MSDIYDLIEIPPMAPVPTTTPLPTLPVIDFFADDVHYFADFGEIVNSQDEAEDQCAAKGLVLAQFRNNDHLNQYISEIDKIKSYNFGPILTGLEVIARPAPWEWELKAEF